MWNKWEWTGWFSCKKVLEIAPVKMSNNIFIPLSCILSQTALFVIWMNQWIEPSYIIVCHYMVTLSRLCIRELENSWGNVFDHFPLYLLPFCTLLCVYVYFIMCLILCICTFFSVLPWDWKKKIIIIDWHFLNDILSCLCSCL